jgi:hypothetical protein
MVVLRRTFRKAPRSDDSEMRRDFRQQQRRMPAFAAVRNKG